MYQSKSRYKRVGQLFFGAGVWDSWGFGIDYCHYSRSLTIEFIHWYAFVEYWTKEEVKKNNEKSD